LFFASITCGLIVGLTGSFTSAQQSGDKAKTETPKGKDAPKAEPVKSKVTAPADIFTQPDFKVELVYEPPEAGGKLSFINLGKDGKGRLILGSQGGHPTLRLTVVDGKVEKNEKLDIPISEIMGILWAHDSLYINGRGPKGFGLYRCKEATSTPGKFEAEFLKKFDGGGEHGPHGLALGQDGKIYIINGNHTKLPEGLAKDSPHRDYKEDHLLPRQWDGNGHAAGILAPGGYVVRTDADGKNWELMLAGFRNAYDHAFNGDGELFAFDSDMEWDWGMPWYRPIRVNHCVSGAEFGWRSGTGKWPSYYPDSLPATAEIGVGSPVGVTNGTGAKFPAKYQRAIYVLDWTYGRIIAVHLKPDGASYSSTFENFVCPKGLMEPKAGKKPLPVTDAIIGDDGSMYFTIGGRNNQTALYRVSYVGKESTAAVDLTNKEGAEARAIRRKMEAFHGKVDPAAIESVWPQLASPDRFQRYAARIAIESQPVDTWKTRALEEKEPNAALTALLALARNGDAKTQPNLLAALEKFPLDKLTDSQKLDKFRVWGLSFIRQGRPAIATAKKIIAETEPFFPVANEQINREAVQILIYLNAPGIAGKALKQVASAKHQEDQFHYLFHLRTLPIGYWTMDQRKEYFTYFTSERKKLPPTEETKKWFEAAGRSYGDGASFGNFIKNFVKEALVNLSEVERKELAPLLAKIDKSINPVYDIKPRPIVKAWAMDEIASQLAKVDAGRDFEKGKAAYLASSCIKCHRFGLEGGPVGPDLTAVASRFDRRAILESILEPSKVISDQYQNEDIHTLSGKVVTGRVVDETKISLIVQPNPLAPERVEIKKDDLDSRKPSKLSPMPANLADVLTSDEILDLIAYMESGGNKGYKAFQKK